MTSIDTSAQQSALSADWTVMGNDEGRSESVLWSWDETSGARVVLLTEDELVLSGPLDQAQLAAIENARLEGDLAGVDYGVDPVQVELAKLTQVRYIQSQHRVLLYTDGDVTCSLEPGKSKTGVDEGVFNTLRTRLPGAHLRDRATPSDGGPRLVGSVRVLAMLGLLEIGSLVLAVTSSTGTLASGPLGAIRDPLSEFFADVGYFPAGMVLGLMAAVQVWRIVFAPAVDVNAPDGTQILYLRKSRPSAIPMGHRPRASESASTALAPAALANAVNRVPELSRPALSPPEPLTPKIADPNAPRPAWARSSGDWA